MSTTINPYQILAGWSSLWLIYNFTLLTLGIAILYLLNSYASVSWLELGISALLAGFAANIAFLFGPGIELLWCRLFLEPQNKIIRFALFGLGYGFATSLLLLVIVILGLGSNRISLLGL